MKYSNSIKSIINMYNKLSEWGKILFFISLFLLIIIIFNKLFEKKNVLKEGFEQNVGFVVKEKINVYDKFYSNIYDHLVFNDLKNNYEISEILDKSRIAEESVILDVGCGTGHHVAKLQQQGLNAVGVDISEDMIAKAKENYPEYKYIHGDILDTMLFNPNTFTHILCLYFTIYYFKDKNIFFRNAFNNLMHGGYLILHLVERELFDPILPSANPLLLISPQRYSKDRITQSKITFNNMDYTAKFELNKNNNVAIFNEKFKHNNTNKVRQNIHSMYMESHKQIIQQAQNAGFILKGKSDMVAVAYEYQYLYFFYKPN